MKKLFVMEMLVLSVYAQAQVGIATTSPNSTLDIRGSLSVAVTTFSSNTTAGASDNMFLFTGTSAATLTLPDATTIGGRIYWVKNISSNSSTLTLATTSLQTIDGLSSWSLTQTNKAIRLISNGTNWYIAAESLPGSGTGSAWTLGGNNVSSLQNIGTTSNYHLPFITNNTEKMRLTSGGSLGIGTSSFNATYPEKLLVDAGSTGNTDYQNVIVGKGNTNSYAQLNIQNSSAGSASSSDVVATANNGSETINYVDMGINGGSNTSTGVLGAANNAYLYATGNDFVIGNSTENKDLIFYTTVPTATSTERMRVTGNGVKVSGSQTATYLNVSGNYTLLTTDFIIINTGAACTWTLPAASSYPGRILHIVNHGTGTLTLSPGIKTSSSATLDTSLSTSAASNTEEVISDGTNWVKISN
jgi:hypothetical protein